MSRLTIILLVLQLCNSQNNTNPCKNNDDCATLGNNYTCVSVQADNSDLLYITQCVKEPVCSGNTFGACPDFTNWSEKYQLITPECSFSIVENCNSMGTNNTVDCYNSKDINKINGIYKCINTNTIKVIYDTTNIPETQVPETQLPETQVPKINSISSTYNLMMNLLCIILNFIIINTLF